MHESKESNGFISVCTEFIHSSYKGIHCLFGFFCLPAHIKQSVFQLIFSLKVENRKDKNRYCLVYFSLSEFCRVVDAHLQQGGL